MRFLRFKLYQNETILFVFILAFTLEFVEGGRTSPWSSPLGQPEARAEGATLPAGAGGAASAPPRSYIDEYAMSKGKTVERGRDGSIVNAKSGKVTAGNGTLNPTQVQSCETALQAVHKSCDGTQVKKMIEIGIKAAGVIAGVGVSASGGASQGISSLSNSAGSCKAMAMALHVASAPSYYVAAVCTQKIVLCQSVCSFNIGGQGFAAACRQKLTNAIGAAGFGAAMTTMSKLVNGECKKIAGNDCSGPAGYLNPSCNPAGSTGGTDAGGLTSGAGWCEGDQAKENPGCREQYCSVPGRENLPLCDKRALDCNHPELAMQPHCVCQKNPNTPGCPNSQFASNGGATAGELSGLSAGLNSGATAGLSAGGTAGTNGIVGALTGGMPGGINGSIPGIDEDPEIPDPKLEPGKENTLNANQGGAGGGVLSGGGAGFGPGGGDGGGQRGVGGGSGSEILSGTINGPNGAGGVLTGTMGASGEGGGSGGNSSGGGGGKEAELDLKSFLPCLPGQPCEKSESGDRGIASAEDVLSSAGITGSNGESNFQKITRKMNEKAGLQTTAGGFLP